MLQLDVLIGAERGSANSSGKSAEFAEVQLRAEPRYGLFVLTAAFAIMQVAILGSCHIRKPADHLFFTNLLPDLLRRSPGGLHSSITGIAVEPHAPPPSAPPPPSVRRIRRIRRD